MRDQVFGEFIVDKGAEVEMTKKDEGAKKKDTVLFIAPKDERYVIWVLGINLDTCWKHVWNKQYEKITLEIDKTGNAKITSIKT